MHQPRMDVSTENLDFNSRTQYEKLQAIDITPNSTGVTVQLKAKSGEVIDRKDIERCLDHTSGLIQG